MQLADPDCMERRLRAQPRHNGSLQLSNELAAELLTAGHIAISTPEDNYNLPQKRQVVCKLQAEELRPFLHAALQAPSTARLNPSKCPSTRALSPDMASICRHHGLTDMTSKSSTKRFEVLYGAVYAELSR